MTIWVRVAAATLLSAVVIALTLALPPRLFPDTVRTRLPGWTPWYSVDLSLEGGASAVLRISRPESMARTVAVLNKRLKETDVRDFAIEQLDERRLLVRAPHVDADDLAPLLATPARLTIQLVDGDADLAASIPPDDELLPLVPSGGKETLLVKRKVELTGEQIENSSWGPADGQFTVTLQFDPAGTAAFAKLTRAHVGDAVAVVMDGKILSAPKIMEPIDGGLAQIDGYFTQASAQALAALLRAGALPAPLTVLDARTIAAGPNSIRNQFRFASTVVALFGLPLLAIFAAFHVLVWRPSRATLSQPQAIALCVRRAFQFSGRARRSEYWWFTLTSIGLCLIALAVDCGLDPTDPRAYVIGPAYWTLAAVLFFPCLTVSIRRLHDSDRRGWWLLFNLIPLVGAVVVLAMQIQRGTKGSNRFGADPVA